MGVLGRPDVVHLGGTPHLRHQNTLTICQISRIRGSGKAGPHFLNMISFLPSFSVLCFNSHFQTLIFAAIDGNLDAEDASGRYFKECREARPSARAMVVKDCLKLWDLSHHYCKHFNQRTSTYFQSMKPICKSKNKTRKSLKIQNV